MYKLVYIIKGVEATARNKDSKVLRNMIKCLGKEDTWRLFNEGGICLDSNDGSDFSFFKGLPKKEGG